MTTIENTTELLATLEAAGVGSRIRHTSGAEYVVGQNDSGWTMTNETWTNENWETFVKDGWSVVNSESLGESTETQTRAEFFRTLNQGDVIHMTGGRSRYLYWGTCRNDEGNRVFRLVTERWVDILDYNMDDSELENDWETIETTNDNGVIRRESVDANVIRYIDLILSTRRDNRTYAKSVDEVGDKLDKTLADFQIVNDKLCEFAVDKGYCPEFEEVISRWNEELSTLELLGRPRQFGISLRIQGMDDSPWFTFYHTARSEREAREHVSGLSTRAIIEQMISNGSYFDGLRFEPAGYEDEGYDN